MYWDPFEELERMHKEIDRLFRRAFNEYKPSFDLIDYDKGSSNLIPYEREDTKLDFFRKPVCHLQETEKNIIAAFELPGVNKDNIELNVDDKSIELKVENKDEKKHEEKDRKFYSYSMQRFYRKINLPKEVDSSKATAEYKDGILRIEMPKKEKDSEKKRLQIK